MRRLIVCADGTWNTPDQQDNGKPAPTNVWKFFQAVDKCRTAPDGIAQKAYYHPGVGTHPKGLAGIVSRVKMFFTRKPLQGSFFQGITGEGLDQIIKECYEWLAKEYQVDDVIYVFGFSRGAYTVRSLAGFIRKCGLLEDPSGANIAGAFNFYRSNVDPKDKAAQDFRDAYSREVNVFCIGVWDTVGALGIPLGGDLFKAINAQHQFHDVKLSSKVKHAYHALALDEHRKPFVPTLWEQQEAPGQTLEQTWFVGSHCNVGGGFYDASLSDITFLWMKERAKRAGLYVDAEYVEKTIKGDRWNGGIQDSFQPPYDLLGRIDRPIGTTRDKDGKLIDTRESLSDSVFERLTRIVPPAAMAYVPETVKTYLARVPSGRARIVDGRVVVKPA